MLDAQLLAQVYIELTGGRQIGLGLLAEDELAPSASSLEAPIVRPLRAPRPHAASQAELDRHRSFMARIAKPLWQRFAAPTSERGAA